MLLFRSGTVPIMSLKCMLHMLSATQTGYTDYAHTTIQTLMKKYTGVWGWTKNPMLRKHTLKNIIPTSAKAKSRFITLKDFSSSKNLSAKMLAQYTTGADSSVFSVKHSWTLAGCRTRHTPAQPTNMCH